MSDKAREHRVLSHTAKLYAEQTKQRVWYYEMSTGEVVIHEGDEAYVYRNVEEALNSIITNYLKAKGR